MLRAGELRQKEVINIKDGARLGFVYDVDINFEKGSIDAIIVPCNNKFMGIFGKNNDYIISWHKIVQVGDDIILVDYDYRNADYEPTPNRQMQKKEFSQ